MKIHLTKPLFAWDCLETTPVLETVRTFFEALPDGKLLKALHCWRGKGRNDYPVSVLWSVYLLRILFRHPTMTAMLEELHRNPALCRLIGIDNETQIPRKYNMSRFEEVLGMDAHLLHLMDIFPTMVRLLAGEVKDLGKDLAGDASALHARRSRAGNKTNSQLPQPSGARKEYKNNDGIVTEVYQWFGYKFHLIVDVKHEVVISYTVTTANQAEPTVMDDLVDQAIKNLHDNTQIARRGKHINKRIKSEIDFRRFCPLPRDTKKFEKLYKKRTAVERTNARLKLFWGVDDGNINGPQRFHARLNTVMVVHIVLAFLLASCPKWEGTLNKTRLSPIAEALKDKLSGKDDSS